jgi:hypothetical protein
MRIYGPSSTRSIPTDRTGTTITNGPATSVSVVGAGTNTFGNYTVPAGRRFVGVATAGLVVTTALAAAQQARTRTNIKKSGGAFVVHDLADLVGAAAAGTVAALRALTVQLNAGDQITVQTDLDAGAGVVQVAGGIHGVEYDA